MLAATDKTYRLRFLSYPHPALLDTLRWSAWRGRFFTRTLPLLLLLSLDGDKLASRHYPETRLFLESP